MDKDAIRNMFCIHGILTGEAEQFRRCPDCHKEYVQKYSVNWKKNYTKNQLKDLPKSKLSWITRKKKEFAISPKSRFDYIRDFCRERNIQSTYVIELGSSVSASRSEPAYPNPERGFPKTGLHSADSRFFYVGQTGVALEDRFHLGGVNHMEKPGSKVRKHRLIKDPPPYTLSIERMRELTDSYGYENTTFEDSEGERRSIKSELVEHYVAWALYKMGHMTWGPTTEELPGLYSEVDWLGVYPYL